MDFSFLDTIYDPLQSKPVKRWVLELPGAGCEWYKKTGGCTMCGFNQAAGKYNFGGKLHPHLVFMAIFLWAYRRVRKARPEQLVIYNGGSFLNDREIPLKTQLAILRFAQLHPTLKKIMVETRAEFITREKLYAYYEATGKKKLEIAIGLESANDAVRNGCLKKGLAKKTFETAVQLCRQFGFETLAYVFLKPDCLSETEAIADAVATIEYCAQNKVDEISLSCAFVQAGTPLCERYRAGLFTPPTLWSIIEVAEKTAGLIPVRIGSFDDTPPPLARPSNCPLCDNQVMTTIEEYRQSHDLSVFDGLDCACRK